MTTVTIDTLRLSDKLEMAGLSRSQADAIVRAIAEAQDELVTKDSLNLALSSLKIDVALLKWMIGFNLTFTIAILWKLLI